MLYDNAQLSRLYLHVYQATGEEFFRRVAEETLDYVVREMTDGGGAFYSTQDADSEGVEGKFFVWSAREIDELLGPDDGPLARAYFDVSEGGNWEGSNILNVPRAAEEVAKESGVSTGRLMEAVGRARRVLFGEREKRIKPGRDEKAIAAWNGMMLASFAEASSALGRDDYRAVAEKNARFLLDTLTRDGQLLHVYKDGQAKFHGYLDDYSCVASGLLALFESTGELRWLAESRRLADRMLDEFWDESEGGFFYTSRSGEALIVRNKDFLDNATPSGNSVAADLVLRLSVLTGNEDYRRRAVTVFRLVRDGVERYPSAFGCMLGAVDFHLSSPKEIVVVGEPDKEDTRRMLSEVWRRYLPNKVVVVTGGADEEAAAAVPLLRDRTAIEGRATAYVCENYTCQRPATTPDALAEQLDQRAGTAGGA
jgi:hypothetical protein